MNILTDIKADPAFGIRPRPAFSPNNPLKKRWVTLNVIPLRTAATIVSRVHLPPGRAKFWWLVDRAERGGQLW
jgi:hypothetical protein